jgi:hypothetical protein
MKDEDLEKYVSGAIEDLGEDITRRAVFGKTKDVGKDACKQIFGEGIIGSVGYLAVNILTGGSLSLLKWLGPAEKVGNNLGRISTAKIKSNKSKWKREMHSLIEKFSDLDKRLKKKGITDSERKRISKEMAKVAKKQDQLAKKIGF